jgi:hypothetical protein
MCRHQLVAAILRVHAAADKQNKRWALTNIKAGDEITNTYLPAPFEYDLRQAATKSIWGFECTCDLCQLDAKDDHTSRSRMTTADESLSTAARLQLIRSIQATYAEDRVLRPAVAMHSARIARDKTLPAADRFKVSRSARSADRTSISMTLFDMPDSSWLQRMTCDVANPRFWTCVRLLLHSASLLSR